MSHSSLLLLKTVVELSLGFTVGVLDVLDPLLEVHDEVLDVLVVSFSNVVHANVVLEVSDNSVFNFIKVWHLGSS